MIRWLWSVAWRLAAIFAGWRFGRWLALRALGLAPAEELPA